MAEGIRRGADYLEIDVQLTKDRIPVIFHDVDTGPKTGLPGYIHEYTYSELHNRFALPTLEEAMRWGKANNVNFALEIKSYTYKTQHANHSLMEPMYDVIKQTRMIENVEVFGIDYSVLRTLKRIAPELEIGLIVPFIPTDPVALMREMEAMVYLSYVHNLTQEAIRDIQDHGYFVSGAILQSQTLIEYAIQTQVDMFEHDHPEKFKRV